MPGPNLSVPMQKNNMIKALENFIDRLLRCTVTKNITFNISKICCLNIMIKPLYESLVLLLQCDRTFTIHTDTCLCTLKMKILMFCLQFFTNDSSFNINIPS